ncbi:MAG: DUF2637 domain-containing protein, partial [Actinomycetota bacterium]
LALVAPVFLGLAIVLWHRAHRVLTGRSGVLFTVGLAGIAGMCFVVSYTHIRDLALASGQSELAAGLLPLVIDGTAVLSSVVVLACGRHLEALAQVEAAEAEAAALARQAADEEAHRQAEVERAEAERITAEAEADRSRIAAEAEAERALLAERRAAADTIVEARKTAGAAASAEDTEAAIAAFMVAHADDRDGKGPTLKQVADAVGIKPRSVQRYAAWTNRNNTGAESAAGPESGDRATGVDGAMGSGGAELNGSSSDGETTVLEAV